MNRDEVLLTVKNARVDKFISYSIEADLFSPEGSFSFECDSQYDINEGDLCEIYVNRVVVLTGIVLTTRRTLSKQGGPRFSVEGKSTAWLLSNTSVTKFGALPKTLPGLAEKLVRDIPFISKKDFVYNSGASKDRIKRQYVEVSPGDSVFDVIKKAANSQGYLFWVSPEGQFVFDKPLARGSASFHIHAFEDVSEMDYIEGSVTKSIESGHSEIRIVGESQSDNDIKYTKCTVKNSDYPFKMPLVANWNENEGPAKKTAELQLATEKAQAIQLEYTVAGHSQKGNNWTINQFCDVQDDFNGANDNYLIVSRTFTLSRQEGKRTRLTLQPGGVI